MDIRRITEEWEAQHLSQHAQLSNKTKGRQRQETSPCEIRTVYQRDRDRIVHSKSFRRLKHKTQVFISPEGDHYRTRLTHTLEVAQIARTVARALRLNEDLTEAIAVGHDLGHTAFGHAGEIALDEVFRDGFKHNQQSLRVVDYLEGGLGLNLTWEVRDGILNHTGPVTPATLEGQIVKSADRLAYINHDIDDAIRAGIISQQELPKECLHIIGHKHGERINNMVRDMVEHSWDKPYIAMSETMTAATNTLRDFLFAKVYIGSEAKKEESKAKKVLQQIFLYFKEHPEELPVELLCSLENLDVERVVCDYVAGMTDRYAISQYQQLFVPHGFPLR